MNQRPNLAQLAPTVVLSLQHQALVIFDGLTATNTYRVVCSVRNNELTQKTTEISQSRLVYHHFIDNIWTILAPHINKLNNLTNWLPETKAICNVLSSTTSKFLSK